MSEKSTEGMWTIFLNFYRLIPSVDSTYTKRYSMLIPRFHVVYQTVRNARPGSFFTRIFFQGTVSEDLFFKDFFPGSCFRDFFHFFPGLFFTDFYLGNFSSREFFETFFRDLFRPCLNPCLVMNCRTRSWTCLWKKRKCMSKMCRFILKNTFVNMP